MHWGYAAGKKKIKPKSATSILLGAVLLRERQRPAHCGAVVLAAIVDLGLLRRSPLWGFEVANPIYPEIIVRAPSTPARGAARGDGDADPSRAAGERDSAVSAVFTAESWLSRRLW